MRSIFVTGTGPSVGKTVVAKGLAHLLELSGLHYSVMLPNTAATKQAAESASGGSGLPAARRPALVDHDDIRNALMDGELLPPSVRRATPDYENAVAGYRKFESASDVVLLDCDGGIMGQVDGDHLVADLIADLGTDALIVCGREKGEARKAAVAVDACTRRGIGIAGIIINDHAGTRYPWIRLTEYLEGYADAYEIGRLRHLECLDPEFVASRLRTAVDLAGLFGQGRRSRTRRRRRSPWRDKPGPYPHAPKDYRRRRRPRPK